MTTSESSGQRYDSRQRAYWRRLADRERKRAKRGWVGRRKDMADRAPDADTLRWRALQDRKGQFATLPLIKVRHGLRRIDSYDLFVSGKLVASGGRVALGQAFAKLLP